MVDKHKFLKVVLHVNYKMEGKLIANAKLYISIGK